LLIDQLERELEEKERRALDDLKDIQEKSEESLQQLRNFYEMEKERLELRLTEERDRASKKISQMQEEFESRIRDEQA